MRWSLGLVLLAAGCAPGSDLPKLASRTAATSYRLSSGDEVRIITYGEQSLTGLFTVDGSGNIALPLVGSVPADGQTTDGLAVKIAAELRAKNMIGDPSVVVEVATYRPVFVLGEVQHPGQYPFRPHMTMLSAVALAGGFTPRAVLSRASVVRTDPEGGMEGAVTRSSQIEPGDIVTIFERVF